MASPTTNLVNLERVSLVFGTTRVLDGVSIGVLAGDRIGVVGRNGGGKSTLLRVIAGSQEPDEGRVSRQGGAEGIRVGMLSQDDSLDPGHTVREAVLREPSRARVGGRRAHPRRPDRPPRRRRGA